MRKARPLILDANREPMSTLNPKITGYLLFRPVTEKLIEKLSDSQRTRLTLIPKRKTNDHLRLSGGLICDFKKLGR